MKVTHAGVLEVLTTVGPLTSREVAEFFQSSSHEDVAAVLSSLRTAARKRVYVQAWTRDNGHGKCVLRRIYAAGDQADAKAPPRMPRKEITRRYRERNRLPKVANSIWTWRPGA
jgi:hypothetical protein